MDEKLFFNSNQGISVMNYSIQNNKIFVPITDRVIGLDFICKLIHLINYIEIKYARIKIPIILHFQKVDVIDKLTIAFLESICNYIISNCNRAVKVDLNVSDRISSAGITSSILMLLTTGKKKHIDDFKIRYYFDQYKNHYRRIISGDEKKDSAILSDVYSEIDIFFKCFSVSKEARREVAEFLIELVGNVKEHTNSSCIIDLDVTPASYMKVGENEDEKNYYYGINIAVLNFSEKLLGDGIKELILNNDNLEDRYQTVREAFDYHKDYFNKLYDEEDFFNITVFQHKISGREDIVSTGGTGLTRFISSLENKADAHHCYMLSGHKGIYFKQEYLEYNKDMWIGFNDENDYIEAIPEISLLVKNKLFMPGTAYNLNFVMKKENIENE